MVLVDNGGGHLIDFDLGPGRNGVNGVAEGVDRQHQQDRVGADAVELLEDERKDVEQLSEQSGLLFPQHERRHGDEEDGEDRERHIIDPELGEPQPLGEGADAICWNQDAGKARPMARPRPESDETGTSSPEKLAVGMRAMQVVPNTAATCVRTNVETRRPKPVAA